jgi:putative transposase
VRANGEIKWRGELVWISSMLVGEPVGIEEGEDGLWQVWFGPVLLGTLGAPQNGWRIVLPIMPDRVVTHHPGCTHGHPRQERHRT